MNTHVTENTEATEPETDVPSTAEQVGLALVSLGQILAPRRGRERRRYQLDLRRAARKAPKNQWAVRMLLTAIAKGR